jgi:hypothetical protein
LASKQRQIATDTITLTPTLSLKGEGVANEPERASPGGSIQLFAGLALLGDLSSLERAIVHVPLAGLRDGLRPDSAIG